METQSYTLPVRVYFQDTDAGGVVFHGSYVNFLERARTEWLRDCCGMDARSLMQDPGVAFVVRALHLEYLKPARLDDLLQVSVALKHVGRSRLVFVQQIYRHHELLTEAEVNVVCVSCADFKPAPVPDFLRNLWLSEVGNK